MRAVFPFTPIYWSSFKGVSPRRWQLGLLGFKTQEDTMNELSFIVHSIQREVKEIASIKLDFSCPLCYYLD
jgi:nitrogen regulatory protein PII-like uncharacterized protein